MFLRCFANLLGSVRSGLMDELERNPQAIRQGTAAVLCFAAAAAAMPAMGERAAEQRADAEWGERALAFQHSLSAGKLGGAQPAARLTLAVAPSAEGLRARANGMLAEDAEEAPAMIVNAALRDSSALAALRPFQPASLRTASRTTKETNCLAEAIYYEARSEGLPGQMAVAEVVVNRVRSGHYPSTFCGVVYQGAHRSTGCQFTFTCDGSLTRRPRGEAWDRAQMIAAQVMMGFARPITHKATHYHTQAVAPVWSASLVETTRIGAHVFYRFPTRAERRDLVATALHEARAQDVAQPETHQREAHLRDASAPVIDVNAAYVPPPIAAVPDATPLA